MKKLIFFSATAIMLIVTVSAQTDIAFVKKNQAELKQEEKVIKKEKRADREVLRKLKGNEISDQSKQAFNSDFGNITVTKWERTENLDKATFTKDGHEMYAFYDYDAKLVGTVQDKSFAALPANAQSFINKKYKDFSKGDVIFFDDNELNSTNMILYHTEFTDANNYFVELQKGDKKIVVQINMSGEVKYFARMK
ncbi:MAG: hypothetical protein ACKVOW_17700 [Chitinophagaceae bacterium]